MKIGDVTNYLEQIAPLRFQEEYDNAGLLVGDRDQSVSGVLVALDATEEVVQEAIDLGCNLVVSHHPIIFKGIRKFNPHHYVDKSIIKAIKHDISLYAIHTNLDNVLQNGVNEKMANQLELQDIGILKTHPSAHLETSFEVGAGVVGQLNEKMAGTEFLDYLKVKMLISTVRHTKILDESIEKVALCGGAGSFLLPAAINAGAQAFITADFKYHEFFDANDRILIVDIGHYESEYFTIELLYELISKKFPNFAAHYTKVITNPVFYS